MKRKSQPKDAGCRKFINTPFVGKTKKQMSLMDIVFKEAKVEDAELLRSIEAGDGYPYPRKKIKEDYKRYMAEGDTFFIAEVDGKPAGYISIIDCDYLGKVCRLHFLAVLVEYQSKGVGTKLMKHFEEEAKKRGYERIIVNVYGNNERAIKFYDGKGYKPWFTIPYRYEEGIDAYVMFKDIGTTFAERMNAKQTIAGKTL